MWALCINGFTLGVNIVIASTYGLIVSSPPYDWPDSLVSFITCGQVVVVLLALPLLGHGSDLLIQRTASRNQGIHEPETRLILLIPPIVVGTFTSVIYGVAASNPREYHWMVYIWSVAAYFFTFLGSTIVTLTYLLDSFPGQAGPVLTILCTFRGFISFIVSNAATAYLPLVGYSAVFATFAVMTAILGLAGAVLYIFGQRLRFFATRLVY